MNIDELYAITRSLRVNGKHTDAWACFLKAHEGPYDEKWAPLFAYEKSILGYCGEGTPEERIVSFMRAYSSTPIDYANLQYHVIPFPCSTKPFPVEAKDDFLPTSTSILRLSPHHLLMNVRFVNYRIQDNGSYLMSENGILSPHSDLRTRNVCLIMNNAYEVLRGDEMTIPQPPIHARNIHGLEDIRLFRKEYEIYFSASSCEYSHNGCIQEVQGVYDIDGHQLTHIESMHSPTGSHVEKNWIPLNLGYASPSVFVYSWHPLRIGHVKDSIFHTEKEVATPSFFKHVRGSSTFVSHSDAGTTYLYAMVHCVIETCPRKYYHSLVKLNMQHEVVAYTVPYYFLKNHIEYTIGIDIIGSQLTCIVSQNDCNPILVQMELDSLLWLF